MLNEITLEEFIKALKEHNSNPENLTDEEREHLSDLTFLRKSRKLVEKLITAAITGFLYITGLSLLYFFVEHFMNKGR